MGGASVLSPTLVAVRTTRLQVRLRDVAPEVVRVIDVPAASTLAELHELLQAGIGWTDSHLHQFVAGDVRYGVPVEDSWDEAELDEAGALERPARGVYLPVRLRRRVDPRRGDHRVRRPEAWVPAGYGACPPEDCGGPPGYEDLLQVLANPADDEHEQMRAWAGDLPPFDSRPPTSRLGARSAGYLPPGSSWIWHETASSSPREAGCPGRSFDRCRTSDRPGNRWVGPPRWRRT